MTMTDTCLIRDFTNIQTIYKARIRTVSVKIQRDYVCSGEIDLKTISNPGDVNDVLNTIFSSLDDDQEHFILLVLNHAHDLTGYKLISSGTQSYSAADCKILFRNALLLGASNIIVAHNHPSNSQKPSNDDLRVTQKIVDAGRLLDIELLDHIVYTSKGSISIKEHKPEIFD